MSKTLAARILKGHTTTGVIAAAMALAFSLATVAPGAAATRHGKTVSAHAQTTYGASSEGDPPPGMTAGQVGHRINPTLPGGSNGFGPPDPASCGGFNC
jgi:uncharacterized membrane protein